MPEYTCVRRFKITISEEVEEAIKAAFDGTIPADFLETASEYCVIGDLKAMYAVQYIDEYGQASPHVCWGNEEDVVLGDKDVPGGYKLVIGPIDWGVDELAPMYHDCYE